MTNYEHSQGGRIWLVWRDEVSMIPVYKTDQLITCSVKLPDQEEFFFTCVYANNLAEDRRELWEDLCHHSDSNLFRNKSWIVAGDFNEILEAAESSRFDDMGRTPSGMREFQRMVLHCRFSDMGFQGPLHTWCNKREEGVICKKLDRVLMNDIALLRFSSAYSVFEAGGCSDHLRCKLQLLPESEKLRKPFKFVNVIGSLPEFLPRVKEYWDTTPRLFHSTSAINAREAHDVLCVKQQVTLTNPCSTSIQEEAEAYDSWLHVANLEEGFLKQKAKLHWLEVGDQNNKSFHNAVRSRQAQNTIREIRCQDGRVVTKQLEIKEEAVRFFSEFLNQSPVNYNGTTTEELQKLLKFRCSDEDCRLLEAEVVSKILANRLKVLLPRVITENQSAFIKGRLLLKNVLLASELVKDYHKEAVSPRCVLKIDISKAFDSVQWSFVLQSLEAIGIDQAVMEKRFKYHPRCKELSLTHLCFADDLMVFVEGTKVSIEGALSVFEDFAKWSGLNISIEKSTVFMAGVIEEERSRILRNFPFAEGNLPVRYLGLPLMTKGMCKSDYLPVVERVRNRINTWNCRFLSYAGRLQLINAVLMSLVNYWAAVFRLPSQCMKEIEQLCAAFLWSGPALKATELSLHGKVFVNQKKKEGLVSEV
ncbi:uncharacterized protein LOC125608589 [Brassica napus]|uniref:uncharacterized protein LOC125608589 n=1 Tax=Brassica napus TaxID=3708 RepID=UPI002078CD7A|nr:uncharacterized protein LOC125608589 [Brassica napus]